VIVLVDSPVWSIALRKKSLSDAQIAIRHELSRLISKQWATLIGPVRQELLSGLRDLEAFETLRLYLRAFPDVRSITADFELAARLNNQCRAHGVQGSPTDFLICATSIRLRGSIYTTDQDFARFARHAPISLHAAGSE
jgi:predicted nucleic acid-binding protein